MKKYLILLCCFLFAMAIISIPEVHDFVFSSSLADGLCLAAPGFVPLKYASGKNNMGGYKDHVLFIPADAVTAVPEKPDVVTANTDLVTAVGSFSFPVGGLSNPIYIRCTRGTVKYDAEAQGEDDGVSFSPSGEFFYPGNETEMHAFNSLVKNTPGYLVIEDTDGKQQLVGQPGLYCYIKPAFTGGQKRSDLRGTKYTFSADSNETALFLATPIDINSLAGLVVVNPAG